MVWSTMTRLSILEAGLDSFQVTYQLFLLGIAISSGELQLQNTVFAECEQGSQMLLKELWLWCCQKGFDVNSNLTQGYFGSVRAGAFGTEADVEEGVSFDWNRYSTPERTLGRSQRPDIRAGVVMTSAGKIWDNELTVRHAPELNNQAHSLVKGTSETRVRKTLASICSWALPLPPKAND